MSISTTIERLATSRYLGTASLVLAIWFVSITLITVLVEPTALVVVVGPQALAIDAAATSGAAVLEVYPGFSRMRSTRPGFVRHLYAAGAWLVWPALDGGCVSPAP